jgi:hypothetical protein
MPGLNLGALAGGLAEGFGAGVDIAGRLSDNRVKQDEAEYRRRQKEIFADDAGKAPTGKATPAPGQGTPPVGGSPAGEELGESLGADDLTGPPLERLRSASIADSVADSAVTVGKQLGILDPAATNPDSRSWNRLEQSYQLALQYGKVDEALKIKTHMEAAKKDGFTKYGLAAAEAFASGNVDYGAQLLQRAYSFNPDGMSLRYERDASGTLVISRVSDVTGTIIDQAKVDDPKKVADYVRKLVLSANPEMLQREREFERQHALEARKTDLLEDENKRRESLHVHELAKASLDANYSLRTQEARIQAELNNSSRSDLLLRFETATLQDRVTAEALRVKAAEQAIDIQRITKDVMERTADHDVVLKKVQAESAELSYKAADLKFKFDTAVDEAERLKVWSDIQKIDSEVAKNLAIAEYYSNKPSGGLTTPDSLAIQKAIQDNVNTALGNESIMRAITNKANPDDFSKTLAITNVETVTYKIMLANPNMPVSEAFNKALTMMEYVRDEKNPGTFVPRWKTQNSGQGGPAIPTDPRAATSSRRPGIEFSAEDVFTGASP